LRFSPFILQGACQQGVCGANKWLMNGLTRCLRSRSNCTSEKAFLPISTKSWRPNDRQLLDFFSSCFYGLPE